MVLRLTALFVLVVVITLCMQVVFFASYQIACEAETVSSKFAGCFCLNHPDRLQAYNDVADLRYYGWTQFFVLLQAVILYVPYYIGKMMDRAEEQKQERLTLAARYVLEVPVLMSLIGVIWLSDKILGGNFLFLGVNALRFAVGEDLPPSSPTEVFPATARCQVASVISNATYEAVCSLPMNEPNSYAFLALWTVYFCSLALSLYHLALVVAEVLGKATRCRRMGGDADFMASELLPDEPEDGTSPKRRYWRNIVIAGRRGGDDGLEKFGKFPTAV